MSITISPCFTVLNQLLHPHFINLWMPTFWLIFDSNLVEYFKLIIRINSTYISIFCECMMTCKSTECYQFVLPIYWLSFTMFPVFPINYLQCGGMGFLCKNTCLDVVDCTTDLSWVSSQAFNQICIAWYGAVWCHSDVMAASNTRYLIPSR